MEPTPPSHQDPEEPIAQVQNSAQEPHLLPTESESHSHSNENRPDTSPATDSPSDNEHLDHKIDTTDNSSLAVDQPEGSETWSPEANEATPVPAPARQISSPPTDSQEATPSTTTEITSPYHTFATMAAESSRGGNRPGELDLSTSELAIALEPFGYGKDRSTGERRTTLRHLPSILAKFQNSRETMYFSADGLEILAQLAATNPDLVVTNEQLIPLLESAKNFHKNNHQAESVPASSGVQSDPQEHDRRRGNRIRSADSPPSSDGDQAAVYFGTHSPSHSPSPTPSVDDLLPKMSLHAHNSWQRISGPNDGDDSFDSINETTLQAPTDFNEPGCADEAPPANSIIPADPLKISTSSKSPMTSPESKRPGAIQIRDAQRSRPRPPNRRKKFLGVDTHSASPVSSREPEARHEGPDLSESSDPFRTPGFGRHARTSASPTITDDEYSNPLLTPATMSSVSFNNRQRGLYTNDDIHGDDVPHPEQTDGTELMRRLRPDSKAYTHLYEYSTPQESLDVQEMCEEYPNLVRSCEELRVRNKELENQISAIEKQHEDEIVKLSDSLEELTQELAVSKSSEKQLAAAENKQRYQLESADEELTRMQKELLTVQNNYVKTKQKWDDSVGELEKVRAQLANKEDEFRIINRSVQSHTSDIRKWEGERKLFEDHIKKLQADLCELQRTREILEEQKQANLDLKATIDRLKYELDEQRNLNSGSNPSNSRPTSFAGSLRHNFGEELKKAMATGDYNGQDSGSDTTEEPDEIGRIVKGLGDGDSVNPDDDVYEEIQIRRIKRRKTKDRSGTVVEGSSSLEFEEVVEVEDAATDCDDLISVQSVCTQTDVIPEPPPVYRPKMEDLQVQTESSAPVTREADTRKTISELRDAYGWNALKHIIDSMMQADGAVSPQLVELTETHFIPEADVVGGQEEDTNQSSKMGYLKKLVSPPHMSSSFTNTIINVIPPISFYRQSSSRPEFNLMNSNLKVYSSVLLLLTTGYFLGNMIFPTSAPTLLSFFVRFADYPEFGAATSAWININTLLGVGQEGLYIGPMEFTRPSLLKRLYKIGYRMSYEMISVTRRLPS